MRSRLNRCYNTHCERHDGKAEAIKRTIYLLGAAAIAFIGIASPARGGPVQDSNKALVQRAMNDLFVKRDTTAIARFWADPYLQHNPTIEDGSADLPKVIKSLPANFKYEPGLVLADGDMVMIHGRYTGWGPKPLVTVDIFRVKNGKLVEHWDVMQEEVPADKTKSGRPMFPITR